MITLDHYKYKYTVVLSFYPLPFNPTHPASLIYFNSLGYPVSNPSIQTTAMMFFKTTTLLGLAAVTLATPAACNSNTNNVALYKPPKFDIFAVIDLRVGWPNNVTTHDGPIAMAPIFGGQVKGKFNGQLHPNISAETERLLPGSDGSRSVRTWCSI